MVQRKRASSKKKSSKPRVARSASRPSVKPQSETQTESPVDNNSPTHALVPAALWEQIKVYIRSVPTGGVPLEQAAMMMTQIQQVQGVRYTPPDGGENNSSGQDGEE